MNKFFIQINENEKRFYDFIIEIINEEFMEKKEILGMRTDIEDLYECFNMLKEFPMLSSNKLEEIQFSRYNNKLRPSSYELEFNNSVLELLKSNNIPIEVYKFN